ncbi:MAG: dihydrolipoyl dehydrogenase [Elusimicrobiota bacterium]|jgi:dihydrolipoamide dehydrogenase|nr:dihydrolipoyl dehydrogenase [Elusimicrobiota bacterium]
MAVKVTVIGAGPGGYVAAIRAAQLGAEVTLIEKNNMGGTCLNVGCIPTKALLHCAEILEEARTAGEYGIDIAVKGFDWNKIQAKKDSIVKQLVNGVTGLMKVNKIAVIKGTAKILSQTSVQIDGKDKIASDKIIIASGSIPAIPPIDGVKGNPLCIDSTQALSLDKVPQSLLVIGGGVIGIELATVYSILGAKVTIIEALPKLLPMMDAELTLMLKDALVKRGINIIASAKVISVEQAGAKAKVNVENAGKKEVFEADKVLVAVGRRTDTESLGLDGAGIKHDRGKIIVNDKMETNVRGIYAIGDCLGKVMLAHTASAQGEIAAENALGHNGVYDGKTSPSCVYTIPEFAGVGAIEEELKEKKIDYIVGKFPLSANGKSLIANGGQGMVKVLLGKEYKEVLGVSMIGPRATDIIGEAALAIGMEATVEDIINTIHAHPTITEAVREGFLSAQNRAIHSVNKKNI